MNTANTYENALIEAYRLHAVTNWFGHSCATFNDIFTARRFLGALSVINGSGLDCIEPEQDATKDGRVFWRVVYEPKTAEAAALCELVSLAYYG